MSNKDTALKFVESMSRGEMDMSMLTDDVEWARSA